MGQTLADPLTIKIISYCIAIFVLLFPFHIEIFETTVFHNKNQLDLDQARLKITVKVRGMWGKGLKIHPIQGISGSGLRGYGFNHMTTSTNPSIDRGCSFSGPSPAVVDDVVGNDDADDDLDDYTDDKVDLVLTDFNQAVGLTSKACY